jgi:DNA mismatch endonuclease, patch repair protein
MTDIFSAEKRSEVMSRIRGADTRPEKAVRSWLHHHWLRFRLHRPDLPGRPDIVLPRHRTVIFVHGCFWHRHEGCRLAYLPKSNVETWQRKFSSNRARDVGIASECARLGWRVLVVWECAIRDGTFAADLKESLFREKAEEGSR